MEAMLEWGMNLVHTVQQARGPVLDNVFRGITLLGSEEFYLLLLPVMLWYVDFSLAAEITVVFLLSSYFNSGMKYLFHQPRPFDIDPNVQLSASGSGYGLPSGHAQSSVVVWAGISKQANRTWLWIAASALVALIGFSRVYLGVHFPTDVLAGWLLGLIFFGAYLLGRPGMEKMLLGMGVGKRILLALLAPAALAAAHPAASAIAAAGVLAGFGTGLALNHRCVRFDVRGSPRQYALRFLVGGGALLVLYFGLKMAFPADGAPTYLWFRFLRYGVVGLWVSFGAPWLFCLMRLAPGVRRP